MNHTIKKIIAVSCSAIVCLQNTAFYSTAFAKDIFFEKMFDTNDDPEKFKYMNGTNLFAQSSNESDTKETDSKDSQETTEPTEPPKPTTPEELKHYKNLDNYDLIEGIDVSKYQPNVDWEAVAEEGIEFVIIRVGYRGYGSEGIIKIDESFETHINAATEAGLDVGVYFYTQAISTDEAIEEANFVLECLEEYELTMPVYIDIESVPGDVGRLDKAKLTVEQHTEICDTFCETIENAGYQAGIYANKYWLEEKLDDTYLASKYPIWLARYHVEPEYVGEIQMWQYSQTGSINGINGEVDRNCLYVRKLSFENEMMIVDRPGIFTPVVYGRGNIELKSSDTSVARIVDKNTIQPVKNGVTTITAKSNDGKKAKMKLIVIAFPKIELTETTLKLEGIGTKKKLATVKNGINVTWESSNSSVVTVSQNGTVKTVGYGSALIIAKNSYGNIGVCEVSANSNVIGDCNNDGNVSALDAAELLVYVAKSSADGKSDAVIDDNFLKRYDANVDGIINTLDAAEILVSSAMSSTKG